MINIADKDFLSAIEGYTKSRHLDARYSSFDFCFNYFQRARMGGELEKLIDRENQEKTCLHLGFYLASWGMMRGSADLLQQSAHKLLAVVEYLVGQDEEIWKIDADSIGSSVKEMKRLSTGIRKAFDPGVRATDTLTTKIILGVMGSVPAFDTYFRKGFKCSTFGEKSLKDIGAFYDEHAEAIDSIRLPTLDFVTGEETDILYSKSKLIDMAFFSLGSGG